MKKTDANLFRYFIFLSFNGSIVICSNRQQDVPSSRSVRNIQSCLYCYLQNFLQDYYYHSNKFDKSGNIHGLWFVLIKSRLNIIIAISNNILNHTPYYFLLCIGDCLTNFIISFPFSLCRCLSSPTCHILFCSI